MNRISDDSAERKALPIATGVLDYFPDALAEVARLSKIGNDKHNPGQALHWSRGKSDDHADCILRHMLDRGTLDTDGVLHDAKVAWRALAQLQLAIEAARPVADDRGGYAPVQAAAVRHVRCVDNGTGHLSLTKGRKYAVLPRISGDEGWVRVICDRGCAQAYLPERFVPA